VDGRRLVSGGVKCVKLRESSFIECSGIRQREEMESKQLRNHIVQSQGDLCTKRQQIQKKVLTSITTEAKE
jgi:hypothetical protein